MNNRLTVVRPPRMWHWRVLRSALAALCGVGLAHAAWYGMPWTLRAIKAHPYFAVHRVEVTGNRRLERAEVLEWAGVAEGMSIWDAAPGPVRERLLHHPWVQRARVQREFPARVMVSVLERRPVALVQLDQSYYVDRSGHILGALRDDDSRDFPIITGVGSPDSRDYLLSGVHRALQVLRWCERSNGLDAVSEVHIDRQQGVTIFPLRTAVAVVLGWGGWREKLARSARVFAAWEGQTGKVAAVDVSFRDLVVVKLREVGRPTAVRALKRGTHV